MTRLLGQSMDEKQVGADQLSLHCGCTPIGDIQYNGEDDLPPAQAVVKAIAGVTNTDPSDLPPIYDHVDPDALDAMFTEDNRPTNSTRRILSFTIGDWNVFVRDDGRIRVCDPTGPDEMSSIFD